uniref:CSON001484 protein n=1 Tax=Culicoides sonorensis TaxID=179676 RepID=A0A336L0I7_CULSO
MSTLFMGGAGIPGIPGGGGGIPGIIGGGGTVEFGIAGGFGVNLRGGGGAATALGGAGAIDEGPFDVVLECQLWRYLSAMSCLQLPILMLTTPYILMTVLIALSLPISAINVHVQPLLLPIQHQVLLFYTTFHAPSLQFGPLPYSNHPQVHLHVLRPLFLFHCLPSRMQHQKHYPNMLKSVLEVLHFHSVSIFPNNHQVPKQSFFVQYAWKFSLPFICKISFNGLEQLLNDNIS